MLRAFFGIILIAISFYSLAQDFNYSVLSIPDSLLKNANAVLRNEEYHVQIISPKKVIMKVREAHTILNESGLRFSGFGQPYDKMTSISSLKGSLYNKFGILIKKASGKDFKDISAISDGTIEQDSRARVHDFEYRDYPFTVEYEYECTYAYNYVLPTWMPQRRNDLSVQQSSFTLEVIKEFKPRIRVSNFQGESIAREDGGKLIWNWTAKGIKAIKWQVASPRLSERTVSVKIAPNHFEFDGYKGNMETWEGYGKFFYDLKKNRDQLPEDLKSKVRALVSDAASDKEKVERLYSFLQKNTRYISIQLGIGGLQPFEANYVYAKGYGDCKALSNYMHSLLKEVNIPSNYTLVQSGSYEDPLIEDFPSDQFDHVILCVPLKGDTMWLECTSQYEVAGFMGSFTGNRKALLITEEGAKVASTPRYTHKQNRRLRKLEGEINVQGTLQLNSFTSYSGVESDNVMGHLNHSTDQEINKWMSESLSLGSYVINNVKHSVIKKGLPVVEQEVDLSATAYATVSGKRIFVCPNILSRERYQAEEEARTLDYDFQYSYTHEDSVNIRIPEGYMLETGIKPLTLESPAGTYTVSFKVEGSSITYYRKRVQFSGRIPASQQPALEAFFKAIMKNDASKIVFVKKEA